MKATHELRLTTGEVLARFKVYGNGRTDLHMHGERHTSRSPSLRDAIVMGHWRGPVRYLYGPDSDAIPDTATLVALEA